MKKLTLILIMLVSLLGVQAQCEVFYVTPNGNGSGTIDDPCSISYAFDNVSPGEIIRLSSGQFDIVNTLELTSNVVVEGGYLENQDWTKSNQLGLSKIYRLDVNQAGVTGNKRLIAITGQSVTGFVLQDLKIETASVTAQGTTTYGLYLNLCDNYQLFRVAIHSGKGGNGVNGINGGNGRNAYHGENGFAGNQNDQNAEGRGGVGGTSGGVALGGAGGSNPTCCGNGDRGNSGSYLNPRAGRGGGGGGAGGQAANSGGYGGGGGGAGGTPNACNISSAGNGKNGYDGSDGASGATGTQGIIPMHSGGYFQTGGKGNIGTDGNGGGGGGGGGGGAGEGGACINGAGSGGGGGGGGGEGGKAGTGGSSGGGAFAVYINNNGFNSTFDNCLFTNGGYGKAGIAGWGGSGGNGGNSGIGHTYQGNPIQVGKGGNGGRGGDGGRGGRGGDGHNGLVSNFYVDGAAPLKSEINYNLAGVSPIKMTNSYCPSRPSLFTGSAGNWAFDSVANPTHSIGDSIEVSYSGSGWFDVVHLTDTFFHYAFVKDLFDNPSFAGSDLNVCSSNDTILLDASGIASSSTGTWKVVKGSAQVLSPNDSNSRIVLAPGVNIIEWGVYKGCCDTFRDTVQIEYHAPMTYNETQTICTEDSIWLANDYQTDPGTYVSYHTSSFGCDSTVITDLDINSVLISVSNDLAGNLSSDSIHDAYQWIDCSNNAAIAGANQADYSPLFSGSYALIGTNNSCSDTSACTQVDILGIQSRSITSAKLYPNPSTGIVNIEFENEINIAKLKILDISGAVIFEQIINNQRSLELNLDVSNGIYFVTISGDITKTMKFIMD